jgi:hypothetical protein
VLLYWSIAVWMSAFSSPEVKSPVPVTSWRSQPVASITLKSSVAGVTQIPACLKGTQYALRYLLK